MQQAQDITLLGFKYSIDHSRCDGCGSCVEVCPVDCITIENYHASVLPTTSFACFNCGACQSVCPQDAFSQLL